MDQFFQGLGYIFVFFFIIFVFASCVRAWCSTDNIDHKALTRRVELLEERVETVEDEVDEQGEFITFLQSDEADEKRS